MELKDWSRRTSIPGGVLSQSERNTIIGLPRDCMDGQIGPAISKDISTRSRFLKRRATSNPKGKKANVIKERRQIRKKKVNPKSTEQETCNTKCEDKPQDQTPNSKNVGIAQKRDENDTQHLGVQSKTSTTSEENSAPKRRSFSFRLSSPSSLHLPPAVTTSVGVAKHSCVSNVTPNTKNPTSDKTDGVQPIKNDKKEECGTDVLYWFSVLCIVSGGVVVGTNLMRALFRAPVFGDFRLF